MLDERVIAAVREGRFQAWAVDAIDQGIEILRASPPGSSNQMAAIRREPSTVAFTTAFARWRMRPANGDGNPRTALSESQPTPRSQRRRSRAGPDVPTNMVSS